MEWIDLTENCNYLLVNLELQYGSGVSSGVRIFFITVDFYGYSLNVFSYSFYQMNEQNMLTTFQRLMGCVDPCH